MASSSRALAGLVALLFALVACGCHHWQTIPREELKHRQFELYGNEVALHTPEGVRLTMHITSIDFPIASGFTGNETVGYQQADVDLTSFARVAVRKESAVLTALGIVGVVLLVALFFGATTFFLLIASA